MLSNVDIKRELGRNLFIYPLTPGNIKGASINLTASSRAWSLAKRESIVRQDTICIPPHDTGLIETEEVVCISSKLAGTFHSRVKTVSMGTGHIGTTMNPSWIGRSLIAVHNHTDRDVLIEVGSPFVTLVLYYLNTKATLPEQNDPGRRDILQGFPLTPEDQDWLYEQDYAHDKNALEKLMKSTPAYKNEKHISIWVNIATMAVLSLFLLALVAAFFLLPDQWKRAREFIGFVVAAYLAFLFVEISKLIKR